MHAKSKSEVLKALQVEQSVGLSTGEITPRRVKYGANLVERVGKKSVIKRVLGVLCEPMLIILLFALAITLGVNVGKWVRTGNGDFIECIGIFVAVLLSAGITVVMESKSERAFEMLKGLTDNSVVKVRRDGEIKIIPQSEVVVGDVVIIERGCKVVADGRLISGEGITVDESTLTGESKPKNKRADAVVSSKTPLADRVNCLYGGTVVLAGGGEMVITAVGKDAEIGKIASELQRQNRISAPLNEKLSRLGKGVTVLGGISATVLFAVSVTRLIILGRADFQSVQEVFIESVVLIVAAVPEGLSTIVAISLSINVMKLARENALIKKLVVAETAGCVSVICSDKTGTLTKNEMSVEKVFCGGKEVVAMPEIMVDNACVNSVCEVVVEGGKRYFGGNPTERALIKFCLGDNYNLLSKRRGEYAVVDMDEFSSEKKYSSAKTRKNGSFLTFYKGAIEKILPLCSMRVEEKEATLLRAEGYALNARRIIAFAHAVGEEVIFDGFVTITDPVRADVKKSVRECKRAGIDVKMLTGDNAGTALAIAREAGIANCVSEVFTAEQIDKLTDGQLALKLPQIKVIARSTPMTKLRVVNVLKGMGEVVAVTGDGVNDAPAIKQSDIGIAMGSGSEIAKEAGDIVLLDDSFSTIVKAIAFGRNVYNNFRRFIMFQLSVNLTAVFSVLTFLFLGMKSPFNALQLLWINVIMDGPPALTLGFEKPDGEVMKTPPKRRNANLVDLKLGLRLVVNSAYMVALITAQRLFNFVGADLNQADTAVFTLFVLLQLFNAFNCRQVGAQSIFKGFFRNRAMLLAFGLVLLLQIVIVQLGGRVFGTVGLPISVWIRILVISSTVLVVSEASKLIYRAYQRLTRVNGVGKSVVSTVK